MTDLYPQAKDWANKIAERREKKSIINTYLLDKKNMMSNYRGITFPEYDKDWLEFVTQSRLGTRPWKGLDFVEGGVADDNVVDTVRLYIAGFISGEEALLRLKYFRPSNQICILTQEIIDKHFTFIKAEEL